MGFLKRGPSTEDELARRRDRKDYEAGEKRRRGMTRFDSGAVAPKDDSHPDAAVGLEPLEDES